MRFTVVLPADMVQDLDILKALAQAPNRNRVIEDAINLLNNTVHAFASNMVTNAPDIDFTDLRTMKDMDKIPTTNLAKVGIGITRDLIDYGKVNLSKYWSELAQRYSKILNQRSMKSE